MTAIPFMEVNDGHRLPVIGFGTYPLRGEDGYRAILSALEAGYRLIDCAANYDNEGSVGRAVRDFVAGSGVDRNEITVQTKLAGRYHLRSLEATEESLYRLGLDRIDIQLIHWPNPIQGHYRAAWEGLVAARDKGVTRSVGTSNFTGQHLADIIADSGVAPVANQIELHPFFNQEQMRAEHARLGIVTQAWSPLGKNLVPMDEPTLTDIAAAHGVSTAQVMIRWHVQLDSVPLPKSGTPDRQAANLDVFGFELSDDDMARIGALTRPDGRIFGGDPDVHEEP